MFNIPVELTSFSGNKKKYIYIGPLLFHFYSFTFYQRGRGEVVQRDELEEFI